MTRRNSEFAFSRSCQHLGAYLIFVIFFTRAKFLENISGRLVYTRQNLWPKPDKGNFAPCIPPCKISGWQKSGKERILSKTPFLTFVYLSKYIKLPVIFGNAKESFFFLLTCLMIIDQKSLEGDKISTSTSTRPSSDNNHLFTSVMNFYLEVKGERRREVN